MVDVFGCIFHVCLNWIVCDQQGSVDPRGARPVEHRTRAEKCASKQWPFCTSDEWVWLCHHRFLSSRRPPFCLNTTCLCVTPSGPQVPVRLQDPGPDEQIWPRPAEEDWENPQHPQPEQGELPLHWPGDQTDIRLRERQTTPRCRSVTVLNILKSPDETIEDMDINMAPSVHAVPQVKAAATMTWHRTSVRESSAWRSRSTASWGSSPHWKIELRTRWPRCSGWRYA